MDSTSNDLSPCLNALPLIQSFSSLYNMYSRENSSKASLSSTSKKTKRDSFHSPLTPFLFAISFAIKPIIFLSPKKYSSSIYSMFAIYILFDFFLYPYINHINSIKNKIHKKLDLLQFFCFTGMVKTSTKENKKYAIINIKLLFLNSLTVTRNK